MMEIYNKLEKEHNDLKEKTMRLQSFIVSDEYLSLKSYSKDYLFLQLSAMKMYENCLKVRMELIAKESSK